MMMALVLLLLWFALPAPEMVKKALGQILFFAAPLFTFWFVERFTDNPILECVLQNFGLTY